MAAARAFAKLVRFPAAVGPMRTRWTVHVSHPTMAQEDLREIVLEAVVAGCESVRRGLLRRAAAARRLAARFALPARSPRRGRARR